MNRVDNLAENELVSHLTQLRHDFDDMKASAQTLGSTSVMLYRVTTGNTYDFHVHCTYNVVNCWQMTFTPSSENIPNTGYLWHSFWNGFNATGSGGYQTYIESVTTAAPWVVRFWIIGTTSGQTFDMDVQAVAYAMSQGSISISQIQ